MYKIYNELNNSAKEYLTEELDNIFDKNKDEELLKRCYKEINILYDKGLLFIVEHLYNFKKNNENISYHFDGTINNLLLLYILGLSKVNPIKYKLPYELFTDENIEVQLINASPDCLVDYLDKCNDFKIVLGISKSENVKEVNGFENNHYLLIPITYPQEDMLLRINKEHFVLETIEDYHKYIGLYISIGIGVKPFIINNENISLSNVIENDYEDKLYNILQPKTMDDYIKLKSISHSTKLWKSNQDELVEKGIVNIKNLIASQEDIFHYLISKSIDKDIAIEIIKIMGNTYQSNSTYLWNKYVNIMREHNCDEMFIQILCKVLFVSSRGQAVSECLFVLDENNYVDLVE